MEKIFDYLEGIFDTLKDNGFFILLAVLFPVLLYKFGAGQEIILDLTSQQRNNTNFFVVASFLFLELCIWCVPTLSIHIFIWLTRISENRKLPILDKLLDLYNAKPKSNQIKKIFQVPVRYIAVLPWIIFICSMANVFYEKKVMIIIIIFLIGTIKCLDCYTSAITKSFDTTFLQLKKYWEIIFLLLVLIVEYVIFLLNKNSQYDSVIFSANIIGVLLSYVFFLVKENSEDFPDGDRRKMLMIHLKTFYMHILLLSIAIGTMFYYFIKQVNGTLYEVSPITIATMIMGFYILIIELLITSQILLTNLTMYGFGDRRLRFRIYRLLIFCFSFLWIFLIFRSTNPHAITKTQVKEQEKSFIRQDLYTHFSQWYQSSERSKQGDSLEVYMVSGQGGGSRAGYWFMSSMFELNTFHTDFYNNLYSISTVSGSSSGAEMFLASKEYYKIRDPKCQRELANAIYRRNYLSGALYGLLIGDFLESITGRLGMSERDRNYYFQQEELAAFEDAMRRIDKSKEHRGSSVKDFFNRDFMYHYNQQDKKYKMPLFFINSTIVENGKKAVFSPVELNTPIHTINYKGQNDYALLTYFEDAYGIFRKCDWSFNKELPMSACVNTSQSFPLINAYSYLHGVGRLADGGLFENSGTSTTVEIYSALKKYVSRNKLPVKFTLITILNGEIDDEQAVDFKRASILNTLTVISKNPFTGHELMALKQLHKQVVILNEDHNDKLFTIKPTGKYNLSRILSERTLKKMSDDLDSVKVNSKIFNLEDNDKDIETFH